VSGAAWKGAAVLLAGGIVLFTAQTARAVRSYAAAPGLTGRVVAEGEHGFRLAFPESDAGRALAGAAVPGRAVVFVYSPECAYSRDNMWNWIDVVRAAPEGAVRFYAVSPKAVEGASGYWAGLARRLTVAVSDPGTLGAAFRVTSTPATVLVEDGRVVVTYQGALTPAARRRVLSFVRGGPGRG
jgi:hypothetical protein